MLTSAGGRPKTLLSVIRFIRNQSKYSHAFMGANPVVRFNYCVVCKAMTNREYRDGSKGKVSANCECGPMRKNMIISNSSGDFKERKNGRKTLRVPVDGKWVTIKATPIKTT